MAKLVTVRWTAVYETVIEVPSDSDELQVGEAAAGISLNVPGSIYQQDTWEVMKITPYTE